MSIAASQQRVLSQKVLAALAAAAIVVTGLFATGVPAFADETPTDVVVVEEEPTVVPAPDAPAETTEEPAEAPATDDATAEELPADTAGDDAPTGASALDELTPSAAPAAAAAAIAEISVSQTSGFDPAGVTAVTVTGTGFTTTGNIGTRPPLSGIPAGVYVVFGKFADTWQPSTGAASSTRTVISQKWAAPGAPAALATNPQYVPLNADGTFTATVDVKTVDSANPNYGIYTYPASGATNGAEELYVPVSFRTPSVEVSQTSGFDPAGVTPVTVTGTGFTTAGGLGTRPPLSGIPAGVYVVFGKFADTWKPSAGAASAARTVISQKWVAPGSPAALAGNPQYVPMNADGTFSATVDVKTADSANPNYGIYVYPASGASNPAEELSVPISFATPAIEVSQTSGFNPAATTDVTVTGSGFTVSGNIGTRPPLSGVPAGVYVVFGKFADTWQPSVGAVSSTRTVFSQKWAAPGAPAALATNPQYIPLNADGTFTATLQVAPGTSVNPNYGIYTYPASGATNAAEELYVPISFATPAVATTTTLGVAPTSGIVVGDTTTLTATVAPAADGTVTFFAGSTELASEPVTAADAVASVSYVPGSAGIVTLRAEFTPADASAFVASSDSRDLTVSAAPTAVGLTWGVKESFRNYVAGPIANGTITVSGGAAKSGSVFTFGSSTGGTFSRETATGTANYVGSVNFTGHSGELNLTITDPSVEVTSSSAGVLWAKVNGGAPVPFATLTLSGGTVSSTDTTVSWANVPAALTTDGAAAFSLNGSNFYAPGTALDPVSFVITAAAVVDEPEPTSLALTATPASGAQVGTSVTLTATVSPDVEGTVTFRSGSTVLGERDVTAGSPSASLAFTASTAGVATLSAEFVPEDATAFIGSDASLDYTVAAPAPTPPAVAAGSLSWGVKESFRSYVTGGIAQGSISTSGVSTDGGQFVFGQSTGGSFTASAGTGTSNYSGSVRFAGHGGLLDLTLSNPIVQIDSATSGTLLVSVNGGGQVAFATLNLAAGSYSTPGNAFAWSGVPASLTSAGASAFSLEGSNFYAPGTALDPVSFVIGSPSSGGSGGTETVSAYQGEKEPAATAPSTEGITILNPEDIVAGGLITATAEGFQANEQDILAVIYSTPVVLSRDLSADANGVATWTGRLPLTLTGVHTLTFQGSVNRGIVLDIPAKLAIAAGGCTVEESTITWGFKETFRSYISGSIANGEWTVADGATYETPFFGFRNGDGSYDGETGEGLVAFPGSITFTGHGGVLNTTVSNPQLKFIDSETAVILLDVSGTTQEGEPISATGVEFVELSLAGTVELVDDVLTITDAPAVLLAAGSEAFGTYEAGEAFDAVSAELALDSGCAAVVAPAPTEQAVDGSPTATDSTVPWWAWVLAILALLAIITSIIAIVVRRRPAA